MKKLISIVLGVACVSCLMVPTMAAGSIDGADIPGQHVAAPITPRYSIFYRENINSGSPWISPIITMEEGYGQYIRVWHKNTTNYPVLVTVTNVDTGEVCKPDMYIPANDQKSETYYAPNETSRYRITVTSLSGSGENVAGEVAVGQYPVV